MSSIYQPSPTIFDVLKVQCTIFGKEEGTRYPKREQGFPILTPQRLRRFAWCEWCLDGVCRPGTTHTKTNIEAAALFIVLSRRIGGFEVRALANFLGRALVASLGMGVALFIIRAILDHVINTTTSHTLSVSGIFLALIKLLIELEIGALVFLIIARRLNIEEIEAGPVRKILNRLYMMWL